MSIFRLYGRVLALLGSESRLAWALALANVALASAQFAEPVLLGRIIDTLTGAQTRGESPSWPQLSALLAAWAGFGFFTIACGTLIALYADRLAHRRRHIVLTGYFEHVLQLPLSYHGNTHSGRLMKVMLQGTDALWGLWVGFFRDHLASFISLLVLLPISLFINWRLALLLIALCVVFDAHRGDRAQDPDLAKLGRTLLFRSCGASVRHAGQHRAGAELFPARSGSRGVASCGFRLLLRKCRCCRGRLGRGADENFDNIDRPGGHHRRTLLHINGQATIGEMVTFNFAGLIIARLEQSVTFINRVVMEAPRLREFFRCRTRCQPFATSRMRSSSPSRRTTSSSRTFRFPMTGNGWRWQSELQGYAGRGHRPRRRYRRRQIDGMRFFTAPSIRRWA